MTQMPGKNDLCMEDEILLDTYCQLGMTSVEIARLTDLPLRVVAWRRAQLGYHRVKMVWSREMDRTLSEMHDDFRSIREIRLALGVSRTAVYERLVQTGIGRRSRAEEYVKVRRMVRVFDDIAAAVAAEFSEDRAANTIAWSALRKAMNHPSLSVTLKPV
ncbi:Lrp/AsnC family transcriptional regulator [Aureimonas sp. Leaf324]|uniref:Lrp/AsnC family transcriptional regulator n=1 Tax=Aureimonas sp. Leaf324 TaxID=1736336 RepID=UPI0006F3C5D0|nr:Lrp/AsnC family transcriptional regulator [Aureimonas sp. Leaf324]KQQ90996.1 hypothetical protein ASF65_00180 [Aureimonas sp. Leaf324]